MAIGHMYVSSPEVLASAMQTPDAKLAREDVVNFTNIQPVMQISHIHD